MADSVTDMAEEDMSDEESGAILDISLPSAVPKHYNKHNWHKPYDCVDNMHQRRHGSQLCYSD